MPIRQHAAHTNGVTTVYNTQTTGYTRNVYSRADSYSKNEHRDWGDWYDAWSNCTQSCTGRADSYSRANSYSRSTAYTKTSVTYTKTTNTNNVSPTITGTVGSGQPNWANNTLLINLSSLSYSDNENNAKSGYRIYYQYRSSSSGSWGTWNIIGANESTLTSKTTTSNSYSWNISSLAQGYYRLAVTTFDGTTWSAILNSGKTGFTNHHRQLLSASDTTSGSTRTVVTVTDTQANEATSYALSSQFSLFKYVPPTWLTNPWKKETIDQLRSEINEARTTFGLSEYTFSNIPVVSDFTIIRTSDITEAQTAFNAVSSTAGKGTPTYSKTPTSNKTDVSTNPIQELQNLLNNLSK